MVKDFKVDGLVLRLINLFISRRSAAGVLQTLAVSNENKDVIRVDGYSKGNVKITHKKGNSLIKAGNRTLAKVLGTKLSKNDLQYSGSNKSFVVDDHDHEGHDHDHHDHDHHGHAHHRKADPNEGDVIAEIFAPVADL